jgi:hypothetical protein
MTFCVTGMVCNSIVDAIIQTDTVQIVRFNDQQICLLCFVRLVI